MELRPPASDPVSPLDAAVALPVGHWPALSDLLEASLQRHADRPALHCLGATLDYATLDACSRAFAAACLASGLEPGHRVLVLLPNLPQFVVVALGALRAGLVLVALHPESTVREVREALRDCTPEAVVVLEAQAQGLHQALDPRRLPALLVVTRPGDLLGTWRGAWANRRAARAQGLVGGALPSGMRRLRDVLAAGRLLPWRPVRVDPGQLAVLQYTGGTTGSSRAAALLQRNVAANVLQCAAWHAPALIPLSGRVGPRVLGLLPLHHIFGLTCVLGVGLHLGGCLVLVPDLPDPDAWMATLRRQPCHVIAATDAMLDAIAAHPGAALVDWRLLRLTVSGGMPVAPRTAARWQHLTGRIVCQGYGLAEASPVVSGNPVDQPQFSPTLGLPLPATEVRLIDEASLPVPRGQPGEIAVRGPQVMAGYWQRPDETARAMTADGFLRTGDIGVLDDQGRLRLVDRKKDVIVVSGFNVYPAEVEDVIGQMPGVLACAAVGVPDARSGEAVKAVVVRGEPAVSEGQVRAWCESNLSGHKRPRHIEFRTELPKTSVGKVLRRALR